MLDPSNSAEWESQMEWYGACSTEHNATFDKKPLRQMISEANSNTGKTRKHDGVDIGQNAETDRNAHVSSLGIKKTWRVPRHCGDRIVFMCWSEWHMPLFMPGFLPMRRYHSKPGYTALSGDQIEKKSGITPHRNLYLRNHDFLIPREFQKIWNKICWKTTQLTWHRPSGDQIATNAETNRNDHVSPIQNCDLI